MKIKFYVIVLLTVVTFGLFACKDDDNDKDPCSVAWAIELSDEASAWSTAYQAYIQDQSTENCNALKAAGQAYYDALEPYGECENLSGVDRESWSQALQSIQSGLNSLC